MPRSPPPIKHSRSILVGGAEFWLALTAIKSQISAAHQVWLQASDACPLLDCPLFPILGCRKLLPR